MTDLTELLKSPDDPSRLVYADYLEERGDLGRANLIRTQCEQARLPRWERRHVEAGWQSAALLAEHGARFRRELPKLAGVEWTEFERGFCSTVRVPDLATLYQHAAAIGEAAPVYRAEVLTLVEVVPYVPGSIPWLKVLRVVQPSEVTLHPESILLGIEALELVDVGENEMLDWLHTDAKIAPLRRLRVAGRHVSGLQFAEQLRTAKWAKGLEELAVGTTFIDYDSGYFQDPTLGESGGIALADLHHVQILDVRHQRVRDAGFAALLSKLPRLRELDARQAEATSLAPLAESRGEPIVRLDLSWNAFGDAGAALLAKAPRLVDLAALNVGTCELTATGLAELTTAPFWPKLRIFDASKNGLGRPGLEVLAKAPVPAELHTLVLADADLEEAMDALVAIPWMKQLVSLDVSSNAAELAHVAKLAGGSLRELALRNSLVDDPAPLAPLVPQLWRLDLNRNELATADFAGLFAQGAPELQSLVLGTTHLDDARVTALASVKLPRLAKLSLTNAKLGVPTLRRLLESFGDHLLELELRGVNLPGEELVELLTTTQVASRLSLLDVRNVELKLETCHALARAEHLRGVKILFYAYPWNWSQEDRDILTARFGASWWWHEDADEDPDAPVG